MTVHPSAQALSPQVLLSFRIGGVQEFIDLARTTEDFWSRSYLLSLLTEKAVQRLVEKTGKESLIFPALPETPSVGDPAFPFGEFPNGLLALVPEASAEQIAVELEALFQQSWEDIATNALVLLEKANPPLLNDRMRRLWESQNGQPAFEVYWAISAPHQDYAVMYREVSALMEARKTLRNYTFSEERYTKCSRCGRREALQPEEGYDYRGTGEFWEKKMSTAKGLLSYRLRPREFLCAVCCTSRLYRRQLASDEFLRFPSTSSLAVAPFRQELKDKKDKLAASADAFVQQLLPLFGALELRRNQSTWDTLSSMDGNWFFAETYREQSIKREYPGRHVEPGLLEKAATALRGFRKSWEAEGIAAPGGYIAVIAFDGDEVGDHIAGRKDGRTQATFEAHQTLSQRLGRIGRAIRPIIEDQCQGRLIYAGGDDFLAIVPAVHVLTCLAECNDKIAAASGIPRFTVSAAALIVQASDSLAGAIRETRELLRTEAKGRFGRQCAVVSLRRGSGTQSLAPLKWSYQGSSPVRDMDLLVRLMARRRKPALSGRFTSHFGEFVDALSCLQDAQAPEVSLFAQHLLRRAMGGGAAPPEALAAVDRLVRHSYTVDEATQRSRTGPELFSDIMAMARKLAGWSLHRAAVEEDQQEAVPCV